MDERKGGGFLFGLFMGLLLGAAIGLLLAPKLGPDPVRTLRAKGDELRQKGEQALSGEGGVREVAEDVRNIIREAVEEAREVLREAMAQGREARERAQAELQQEFEQVRRGEQPQA